MHEAIEAMIEIGRGVARGICVESYVVVVGIGPGQLLITVPMKVSIAR